MALPMLFSWLASQGLGILRDAVITKGVDLIEEKTGLKLPRTAAEMTPEKAAELAQGQMEHEQFLVNAALREKELDLQAYRAEDEERTKRWVGDMQSDSWLSKNVRPMTLLYWTLAVTLLTIIDSVDALGVDIPDVWVEVIKWSYITILGAYFGGRTLEKGTSMVKTMMEKRNVPRR